MDPGVIVDADYATVENVLLLVKAQRTRLFDAKFLVDKTVPRKIIVIGGNVTKTYLCPQTNIFNKSK